MIYFLLCYIYLKMCFLSGGTCAVVIIMLATYANDPGSSLDYFTFEVFSKLWVCGQLDLFKSIGCI